MFLLILVILLISGSVYCDKKQAENSNKTIAKNETTKNGTGEEIANRDLSTQHRMNGQGQGHPTEHLQKQQLVNQYLAKSGQVNARMGENMGPNFQGAGNIQRMQLVNQQPNLVPRNDQMRQNLLNNIRGGKPPISTGAAEFNSMRSTSPASSIGSVGGSSSFYGAGNNPATFGSGGNRPQSFGSGGVQPPMFGSGGIQSTTFGSGGNSQPTFGSGGVQSTMFGSGGNRPQTFGSAINRPSINSEKSYGGFNFGKNEGTNSKLAQQDAASCNVSGRVLLHGDKWSTPGVCGLFTCVPNKFRELSTACPSVKFQEDSSCYVEEQDLSRIFPNCCPKLVCSSQEKNTQQTKYGGTYKF